MPKALNTLHLCYMKAKLSTSFASCWLYYHRSQLLGNLVGLKTLNASDLAQTTDQDYKSVDALLLMVSD